MPVALSTMMPEVWISPWATSGRSARLAAVTWQPGVATSRAPASSLRYSSGNPYTASASISGWSWAKPYQVGYSEASFNR